MMKRKLFILLALLAPLALSAHYKVTVTPEKDMTEAQRRAYGATTTFEVLNENFDGFTRGTEKYPYKDHSLTENGNMIDPDLTHGLQWTGNGVYSAGGCACLEGYGVSTMSLNTPCQDYSGTVHVSMRAKYHEVKFVPEGNAPTDSVRWAGGGVQLLFSNQRGAKPNVDPDLKDAVVGNAVYMKNVRVYEDQGWCQIDIEFDNYDTYSDSYFSFSTSDGVLLDDIRITCSPDKFVGAPVVNGVTDVTDTSFTVNFEPTRQAFDYRVYLYTQKGFDDQGNPRYIPVLEPEIMEALEAMGMTMEDYMAEFAESFPDDPMSYLNYGSVDDRHEKSFTFSGLDPNEQYYYSVRAHYVLICSPETVYPMRELPVPAVSPATDIAAKGFTAAWEPTVKGDGYEVNLYGATQVKEDTNDVVLLHEDFSGVSQYTDSKDIDTAEAFPADGNLTLDDMTVLPGWTSNLKHVKLTDGMIGADALYNLTSPTLYVGGADVAKFHVRLQSTTDQYSLYLNFADKPYVLSSSDFVDDEYFELPTNGLEETTLRIYAPDAYPIFIDELTVTQDLQAGATVYNWMSRYNVGKDANTLPVDELDTDLFDDYAYSVKSTRGEGTSMQRSAESPRMVVELANGTSHPGSGVSGITSDGADVYETERYSLQGVRLSAPAPGINIVKYSDGSVRKIFVK